MPEHVLVRSKTDLPLAKVEPISNSLEWGKKNPTKTTAQLK